MQLDSLMKMTLGWAHPMEVTSALFCPLTWQKGSSENTENTVEHECGRRTSSDRSLETKGAAIQPQMAVRWRNDALVIVVLGDRISLPRSENFTVTFDFARMSQEMYSA